MYMWFQQHFRRAHGIPILTWMWDACVTAAIVVDFSIKAPCYDATVRKIEPLPLLRAIWSWDLWVNDIAILILI